MILLTGLNLVDKGAHPAVSTNEQKERIVAMSELMTRAEADVVFDDIRKWFEAGEYHDLERSLAFEHCDIVLRVGYDEAFGPEIEAAATSFAPASYVYPVTRDGFTCLEVRYPFQTNQPESIFEEGWEALTENE